MKIQDTVLLFVFGWALWILGTIYFANFGAALLQISSSRYWAAFVLSPTLSTALCVAILRWRQIPQVNWAAAMLLLAIPGMIGEAVVLSELPRFMPKLHAASGGRYGALLFATYALALAVAEIVTLKATS
jgi:hypothetical protein